MSLILGFGFKAQSGKDTAVNHLVGALAGKYDARRYAFADELKTLFYDMLLEPLHPYWQGAGAKLGNVSYFALPHPREQFITDAAKLVWVAEHKAELGNHLQIAGSDYYRSQDPFFWVKALRKRIDAEKPQVALISDMRFKTELYYVKAYAGYTIKVSREGFQLNDGRSVQHISETELDDEKFDFEINVLDGEVEQLKRDAETVFGMIAELHELPLLPDVATVEVIA